MPNRIFDTEPEDWRQLENMVSMAFLEMGYETHHNHSVNTVRGSVAIDVYAADKRTPLPTIVLCECKYWNRPVSQEVIYAFRSICADIGAHYGIVISKVGFQSGAKATREATNVHLVDFCEFQEKFFEQWRNGIFLSIVQMRDDFLPALYRDENNFNMALVKYELFEKVSNHFIMNNAFPIEVVDPRGDLSVTNKITILSHRHFFKVAKEAHDQILGNI